MGWTLNMGITQIVLLFFLVFVPIEATAIVAVNGLPGSFSGEVGHVTALSGAFLAQVRVHKPIRPCRSSVVVVHTDRNRVLIMLIHANLLSLEQ
jgi:hypothetical protein